MDARMLRPRDMKERLRVLTERLEALALPEECQITLGFDGFVDSIVRPVRKVRDAGARMYFDSIDEFGRFIVARKGMSCTVELDERYTKIGGNMPITANALGDMGLSVHCIGPLGHPHIHPVFTEMSKRCVLHSVAQPGHCTALEFHDGKVMLANNGGIEEMSWERIRSLVGATEIARMFSESRIVGMLNWGELISATGIWEGVLREVVREVRGEGPRLMLFDLSDCSKRDPADITRALTLMKEFSGTFTVTLSMNEGEAEVVADALGLPHGSARPRYDGAEIFGALGIDLLLIHAHKAARAWDRQGELRVVTRFCDAPVLSTGGGDNFNAGFCLGWLAGMDTTDALVLGNATAGFYVRRGRSPTRPELIEFLHDWRESTGKSEEESL